MLLNTHLWSEFWVALTRMKKENLTNLKKRCAACDCWNGNAKAPRPHQFYMRGMNATSAPPAHSLRSSCVNHARFIRNSLATVRWLCVVFRRVFVTHNHAFALFGAFSCLCAEVRGLLVICAWSFRNSCAIHRWFFITYSIFQNQGTPSCLGAASSCLVWPRLALPCHALSCLVLSCLGLNVTLFRQI